jgi:hypothetical protein
MFSLILCPALIRSIERELLLTDVEGDYYEFGMFEGASFLAAYECSKHLDIHYWGFDSFQGLPKLEGPDAGWAFWEGQFAYSLENVMENLKSIPADRFDLIPGFYSDTLATCSLPFRKARVVLIDCDLYTSTVPVLDFLYPYLQTGTIIFLDDWVAFNQDPNRGVQRAAMEFLAKHPDIELEDVKDGEEIKPSGNYIFRVKRHGK